MPSADGEVQGREAVAVPQADEARAGEGEEEFYYGSAAEEARRVGARVAVYSLRPEQERLPARLDEALCNRQAPFLARDVEAGASVLCCREKERLPSCQDLPGSGSGQSRGDRCDTRLGGKKSSAL